MKTFIAFACTILFSSTASFAQTEFVLVPSQSMLITGKGAGQDGTINPFEGRIAMQSSRTLEQQLSLSAFNKTMRF